MNTLRNSFQKILYYPSALLGLLVVFLLVFTAIYAMIKIPYEDAIRLWRGGEEVWYQNPKFAPPATPATLAFPFGIDDGITSNSDSSSIENFSWSDCWPDYAIRIRRRE